jgi:hypothetical protein
MRRLSHPSIQRNASRCRKWGQNRPKGDVRDESGRPQTADLGLHAAGPVRARLCSLIPGMGVKLSANILAGPTVLSAVGARPPHDGVRRRWRINVASAVAFSGARKKSGDLTTATVPAGTSFPALSRDPCDLPWCALRGSLLRRPVKLGAVDPHAVQNDRELASDSDFGLAEPVALDEPRPPSLERRPFRDTGQQHTGCFK